MWYIESTPHIFLSTSHLGFVWMWNLPLWVWCVCWKTTLPTRIVSTNGLSWIHYSHSSVTATHPVRWRYDLPPEPGFFTTATAGCETMATKEETDKTHWPSFSWCARSPSLSRIVSSQHAQVSYVRDQTNSERHSMALRSPHDPWWLWVKVQHKMSIFVYCDVLYYTLSFGPKRIQKDLS